MKGLLIAFAVLLVAVFGHKHGGNHHDHDHDHSHHGHSHHHHKQHETESTGGFLASAQWLVEWILIGAIAVLSLFIIRMLAFGSAAAPKAPVVPKRTPPQIFLTREELARFDGSDKSLPVYVAIRGTIFDVTPRRDMYGVKGQGYNCLAGRDAARALGKHALDEETCRNPKIDDLTPGELEAVDQWESSFRQKYRAAGQIVFSEEEKAQKTAEEKKRYDAETVRLEQQQQEQKTPQKL